MKERRRRRGGELAYEVKSTGLAASLAGRNNLRWSSAFPARAKQAELLFGFRGTGPQRGHGEWEVEQWAGQTDKQGHRSRVAGLDGSHHPHEH